MIRETFEAINYNAIFINSSHCWWQQNIFILRLWRSPTRKLRRRKNFTLAVIKKAVYCSLGIIKTSSIFLTIFLLDNVKCFHVEIIQLMRQNFLSDSRVHKVKNHWRFSFEKFLFLLHQLVPYTFFMIIVKCVHDTVLISFWIIFTDCREEMKGKKNRDQIRAACFGFVKIYEDWRWNIKKEKSLLREKKSL